ncbi:MAG: DUF2281 domain-containing protein [Bacteroidales bacterium]|nr:DUF2281 domain-containing protein [Bacteroidales bacterium]
MEIINYISDFENLPKQIQQQVLDYIEFLLDKYQKKDNKNTRFSFDWEDGLSELKNDYTSVKLQHQANFLR